MAISASDVKRLREETGAGMMDCKKALEENNGDYENSKDWLREKGIAGAAKKASRVAAEGLVGVKVKGNQGVLVELNSETDFVAKNEQFQKLLDSVLDQALEVNGDYDALKEKTAGQITDAVATIRENMSLRRSTQVAVNKGIIGAYIHNQQAAGLGQIGVLVALESDAPAEKLEPVAKQLAMHVAAAKPTALSRDEVDSSELDRERKIFSEQAKASGKPEEIIAKMVEGRIRKYYEEVVLPEQTFVIDGKTKISDFIEAAAKEAGAAITLKAFVQYTLGEGIEKEETDFAAEVQAAASAA